MLKVAFVTVVCLAACSTGSETTPPDYIAEMQIGVARAEGVGFLEVNDGSDAILASGSQGGFHVWTAPRFSGAAGTVYLDRQARRVEDGALVLRAARLVIDIPEDAMTDWWHQEQALPSFMCPTPVGIAVFDTEIEFSFELRNEDEEILATDSIVLIPRCGEGEDGEWCRRICSG